MNFEQYTNELANGHVLGMFDQAWDFGSATASLTNEKRYAETLLPIPLMYSASDLEGIAMPSENWDLSEHYINAGVINKDRGFGIAKTAEDPERLVQLIDTLLSDEWQIALQWGIEDEDWYTDENGRMNMTAEQYQQRSDSEWVRANKADAIFTSAPKKAGTMDNGNSWSPDLQPEIRNANLSDYDKALYEKLGIKAIEELFSDPIELAPYGEAWQIDKGPIDVDYQKWLQLQVEWLPKIISGPEADFDANWAAFTAELAPYSEIYANFMHEEILKQVYPERYQ
jgi:putative aldouronate transport system substrate-binding protein